MGSFHPIYNVGDRAHHRWWTSSISWPWLFRRRPYLLEGDHIFSFFLGSTSALTVNRGLLDECICPENEKFAKFFFWDFVRFKKTCLSFFLGIARQHGVFETLKSVQVKST